MTAAAEALSEVAAIAKALASLPDCRGTPTEIATACGLPRATVVRRLMGSGSARPSSKAGPRVFSTVVGRHPGSKVEGVYSLTPFGLELAQSEETAK